ncbi:MAG: glycoside hydrolase family 9 protein [Planctomycetota bacterium]|nr:glycoside hydrolase family 9 protein [Planctomycetota bacterium]
MKTLVPLLVLAGLLPAAAHAALVKEVQVADRELLVVHVLDGEVKAKDDGQGPGAYGGHGGHRDDQDIVTRYTPALDTAAAVKPEHWTLSSAEDAEYGAAGAQPLACHRKTKMNGHAEQGWVNNDFHYEYTFEHFIYLKLPKPLQQGKRYTLKIAGDVKTDKPSAEFVFDVYASRSEAIHVNLAGYTLRNPAKAADLYLWMGDGGPRDYKAFEGQKVYLYDVKGKKPVEAGAVRFGRAAGPDVGGFDLTKSNVWFADADAAKDVRPAVYRLVVDGVGCSQDFEIRADVYREPFKISVLGFYYMRIGEEKNEKITPVPRQPRFIPGKDPANCKVVLTTMQPYHKEWKSFTGGDAWDKPDAWKRFSKEGAPTNPNAFGGHSDALDWDRHLGHVSIIYDMLLPYILTGGKIGEDDLGIAESGNGIPDILDEARNEVDFWLRLRDGKAYSHGLTNPDKDNVLFQAGPTAVAAWANAANAAMLAEAFRVAGNEKLKAQYTASAREAYDFANGQPDPMLDQAQGVGDSVMRGRDFKMTAAAYLFNLTGEKAFEDALKAESLCTGPETILADTKHHDQIYATAAYLTSPQKTNYPDLVAHMKKSVLHSAHVTEADQCKDRPSRRASRKDTGWFRTSQNVQLSILAHAIASDEKEKAFFLQALTWEADYGLGRNPLNMIEMTTATTAFEHKRSVLGAYTSGRNDGSPGMHPGHTPYMNLFDWGGGMTMGRPTKLWEKCYPADFPKTWPHGEGYFDTRYVYAANEFTPQQTMRGKMALYGYLYGIEK